MLSGPSLSVATPVNIAGIVPASHAGGNDLMRPSQRSAKLVLRRLDKLMLSHHECHVSARDSGWVAPSGVGEAI